MSPGGHERPTRTARRRERELTTAITTLVVIGVVVAIPGVALSVASQPWILVVNLIALLVIPLLLWLDAVGPQLWSSRITAMAWGAGVAAVVAGAINTGTALWVGEGFSVVVSAPLSEELLKGLGVMVMLQRRMIVSVVDGIVYAAWIGLGFSLVENVGYFVLAARSELLLETLFVRGVLTSLAHPLFTVCVGWAVGNAVARGRPVVRDALVGWLLAVIIHGAWNFSLLSVAAVDAGLMRTVMSAVLIVAVLTIMVRVILHAVLKQQLVYLRNARSVMDECDLGLDAVPIATTWRSLRSTRRSMTWHQRREFDRRRSLLARIIAVRLRPGPPDQRLLDELVSQFRGQVSKEEDARRTCDSEDEH